MRGRICHHRRSEVPVWWLWMAARAAEVADQATVLSGFEVTWERRPHRIKVFGIHGDRAELDAFADIQGGSWADGDRGFDTPRAEVDLAGIGGRSVVAGTSEFRIEGRGGLRVQRRELGTASATLTVDGVDGDLAVWLTGFRFATDEGHPDGFTLHTLSVALGAPQIEGGTARIPVEVSFGGGSVPDRAQSLGSYGAEIAVDWAAVRCAPGEVQRETVESEVRLGPIAAGRHQDAERVSSELGWGLGGPVVAGLSGFRIDIDDGLFDGRYARSFLVRIAPTDDPLRSEVQLGFDNAGPLARALRVELEADVTALAVRPTDEIWARSYTHSRTPERITQASARRRRP